MSVFGLGVQEIALILILALLFFGADKIPKIARSLGKGLSELHRARQDFQAELEKAEAPVTGDEQPAGGDPVCPGCQSRILAGASFCSHCGCRLSGEIRCGYCQRRLSPEELFCPNCGKARPGMEPAR